MAILREAYRALIHAIPRMSVHERIYNVLPSHIS